MAIDATGMCMFIAFPVLDQPEIFQALVDIINGFFGLSLTGDDVTALGKSILKNEKDFNEGAGFTYRSVGNINSLNLFLTTILLTSNHCLSIIRSR